MAGFLVKGRACNSHDFMNWESLLFKECSDQWFTAERKGPKHCHSFWYYKFHIVWWPDSLLLSAAWYCVQTRIERKSVDLPTVEKQLLKIMRVVNLAICNADETCLLFRLPVNKALSLTGDPCNGRRNCEEGITVLLACSANCPDKHPPLVTGKIEKPHWFKNVRKLPTKYVANRKAWVTDAMLTNYLRVWDGKMKTKTAMARGCNGRSKKKAGS